MLSLWHRERAWQNERQVYRTSPGLAFSNSRSRSITLMLRTVCCVPVLFQGLRNCYARQQRL
jgi:hypothetical protein